MAAQANVGARRGSRPAKQAAARHARFATIQKRLQPRVSDMAALADRLRGVAADEGYAAIRPEVERIRSACADLAKVVAGLTRKKSIDRLLPDGDAVAAQEALHERLRGPIKVIGDCGEIVLEALPV